MIRKVRKIKIRKVWAINPRTRIKGEKVSFKKQKEKEILKNGIEDI